ncbi:hypothetical protein NUW54_g513 [Trametes sanguinea]|uniref:Uncharacterized protein n=1 Tax=Trametes sanguinea TaxID=158606 RepID=A0ACC1QBQ2_9APHY|nr:hypothetical protein NUW54_g513 [Trametes sanguinea]
MAANLNAACNQSVDPPNAAPLPAAQPALTGCPGHPCIEIDWQFLEFALDHALNAGAHAWADAWNAHQLNITGEQVASPHKLFMFGMHRHGPRGIERVLDAAAADDLGDGDPANYGINWDAIDNTTLMVHHLTHNLSTTLQGSDSPFGPASGPEHLTEVICNPSGSPLTSAHLTRLDSQLAYHCDPATSDMQECKLVWIAGFAVL